MDGFCTSKSDLDPIPLCRNFSLVVSVAGTLWFYGAPGLKAGADLGKLSQEFDPLTIQSNSIGNIL